MRTHLIAGLILPALLASRGTLHAIEVPDGYQSSQTEVADSGWWGRFDCLHDGRFIISDNEEVFILDADGTRTVVARFETPGLFGTFVKVAPDRQTIYVGESSVGTISGFELGAAEPQDIGPDTESVVATVELNYDMEFDPQGRAFVSAATPTTWQPNRLLLLNLDSGETNLIAIMQGNSGPIVVDEEGTLFYCTSTSYPPAPVESVLVFTPEQIDQAVSGDPLTESDARTYVSNIFGLSDMAFDSEGDLFGVTSSGEIVELSEEEGSVTARTFGSVSPDALGGTVVRFHPGLRAFEPYYQDGGVLTFLESDFGSFFRLVHVATFPEFRTISMRPSSEGVTVGFATETGKQYQVYWSDDPAGDSGWQACGPALTGEGQPTEFLDEGDEPSSRPSPSLPSIKGRFYKVGTVE